MVKQCFTCGKCRRDEGYYYCTKREEAADVDPHGVCPEWECCRKAAVDTPDRLEEWERIPDKESKK